MIFHTRRPFPFKDDNTLSILDHPIKRVSHTKYLGIILDEKLTWNPQINKIKLSLYRAHFILRKLSYSIPPQALIQAFYSIFFSHLNYANLIWGSVPLSKLNPLNAIYQRTIKLIHRSIQFRNSNLVFLPPTLAQIHYKQLAILFYKYKKSTLPSDIQINLSENITFSRCYSTRSAHLPVLPFIRTEIGRCSISYQIIKNYQELINLSLLPSLNALKLSLKNSHDSL